jgi:hypothetical protein
MPPWKPAKFGSETTSGETARPDGCGRTMKRAVPPASAASTMIAIGLAGPPMSAVIARRCEAIQNPARHSTHAASRMPNM